MFHTTATGYLINPTTWDKSFAQKTATEEGILLTDAHWEILLASRQLVLSEQQPLGLRKIIASLRDAGAHYVNSLYIQRLFPGFTLQLIAKLAGLAKPAQCI